MELRRLAMRDRPFVAIAIALGRAAGPPALLRAVPPFAAIGLASSIVFGGYGMSPRDLVALTAANAGARVALWIAWILVTAPAARALLATPEAFVLRSLPVPLAWFWIVHASHLVALQAPWALLFAAGAGPLAAIAAAVAGAAASAIVVARLRSIADVVAAVALTSAIALGAPPAALAAAGIAAVGVGVASAFRRAPERAASAGRAWMPRSAPIALAIAHAAVLVRRDAITLVRGAAAALVGALIASLAARNNAVTSREEQEGIALAAGAIPLAIAVTGVAGRVLVTERGLAWLLLSSGASARLRAVVAAALTATWGAATGALYGVAAAIAMTDAADRRARIALLAIALGASLAAVGANLARRAERPTGVDGTAVVAGMTAAAALSTAAAAWLGALAIAPIVIAASALLGTTPLLLAQRERLSEHETRAAWEDG